MPDWNTRLAVYIDDADDPLTPIDAFSPSFALNAEPLHSIEQTHLGVVYAPQTITFSMTVRAIGDAVAKLTTIALQRKRFKVALEFQGDRSDWAFDSIVLSDCIITSASPSPATISGAPAATFSGMSLAAGATPAGGVEVTVP
ncbi:hypothetical protein [Actinomycetospora straminea]|uniref:Immunity protein 50 of polymorphic toxin system n=1 Tax=Actinomycetospora straminea TaxID=663607 RepID=A0ABP9EJE6_9PSEU|nr:hypothetical protein [Actinomycetospora straminea]MDD7933729.1 hypothetical protein [Actinomycetospora straminea]